MGNNSRIRRPKSKKRCWVTRRKEKEKGQGSSSDVDLYPGRRNVEEEITSIKSDSNRHYSLNEDNNCNVNETRKILNVPMKIFVQSKKAFNRDHMDNSKLTRGTSITVRKNTFDCSRPVFDRNSHVDEKFIHRNSGKILDCLQDIIKNTSDCSEPIADENFHAVGNQKFIFKTPFGNSEKILDCSHKVINNNSHFVDNPKVTRETLITTRKNISDCSEPSVDINLHVEDNPKFVHRTSFTDSEKILDYSEDNFLRNSYVIDESMLNNKPSTIPSEVSSTNHLGIDLVTKKKLHCDYEWQDVGLLPSLDEIVSTEISNNVFRHSTNGKLLDRAEFNGDFLKLVRTYSSKKNNSKVTAQIIRKVNSGKRDKTVELEDNFQLADILAPPSHRMKTYSCKNRAGRKLHSDFDENELVAPLTINSMHDLSTLNLNSRASITRINSANRESISNSQEFNCSRENDRQSDNAETDPDKDEYIINSDEPDESSDSNSYTSEASESTPDSNNSKHKIDGLRITDINFILEQLKIEFGFHAYKCPCRLRDLILYKSHDRGMRTQLFFKCKKCDYKNSIWTNPERPTNRMTLHESLVCGTITAGIGYSTLREVLAAASVPVITDNTYRQCRDDLTDLFDDTAWLEMYEAAELEKKLAIEAGDVTMDGLPYITVIADGGWGKRSYRTGSYDSLSGVAVIVGFRTGKVLYIGVRNKFCSFCSRAKSLSKPIGPHKCYKNWGRDQPSTSMEKDIVVEGFKLSVPMYGLIFKTLIADGDSSVYAEICKHKIYHIYNIIVDKVECKNHAYRNFCNKISAVSKMTAKTTLAKGEMKPLRDRIKASALKMRKYIEEAVDRRAGEDISFEEQTAKLMQDILRAPGHVLGNHSACEGSGTFCEKKKPDIIPKLRKLGFYENIYDATKRLSTHAASLLKNLTNNPAEWFNSIVAKFVGGKRINYSSRNSYQMRCMGAVIQHNSLSVLSKLNSQAGMDVPSAVVQLEQYRQAQHMRNRKSYEKNGRSHRNWRGTDKDYGPASQQEDVGATAYHLLVENHLKILKERQQRREQIASETIEQSGNDLWFIYRTDIITASHFGRICRMRESTSCANIVKDIRYPTALDNVDSIRYGRENEGKAREDLSKKINKEIVQCGLFIDSDICYLGASPDGLIDSDGIVEIKCPSSAEKQTLKEALASNATLRNIFDKKNTELMNQNHVYYYQVQGQLHILQRDYCIFALWTPLDLIYVKVIRNDEFWKQKMLPILSRFWNECLLPEIVDSRRNRNMQIKDPEYIMEAKRAVLQRKKVINNKKRKRVNGLDDLISQKSKTRNFMQDDPLFTEEAQRSNRKKNNTNSWQIIINDSGDERVVIPEEEREVIEVVRHSISLNSVTAEIMELDKMLDDDSIEYFMQIVEENSDFTVYPVLHYAYQQYIEPSTTVKDLQIIGGNATRHWCCLHYDGSQVIIYDSLNRIEYEQLKREELRYITKRYPHITKTEIILQPVTKQPDSTSCGVYAAAYATTIVLGSNPSDVMYSEDITQMRNHMRKIVETRRLIPFPTRNN